MDIITKQSTDILPTPIRSAVSIFANLGKDATLVVPSPISPDTAYTHIAAFVRHAPAEQVDALFMKLANEVIASHVHSEPRWISTSGLGVYWLHVRIDSRPKYYQHAPYKTVR